MQFTLFKLPGTYQICSNYEFAFRRLNVTTAGQWKALLKLNIKLKLSSLICLAKINMYTDSFPNSFLNFTIKEFDKIVLAATNFLNDFAPIEKKFLSKNSAKLFSFLTFLIQLARVYHFDHS